MKRVLLSLALSLIAAGAQAADAPASAASAVPVTKEELAARARSEGALGVMAQACGVPKAEVSALVTKSRNDTLALAKNLSVKFDAGAYRAQAASGADDAREVVGHQSTSGLAYEKRCAQVRDRIKRKMTV